MDRPTIIEQWDELKETIIELRDNNGTATQQEVCQFLVNLMNVLESERKKGKWVRKEVHSNWDDWTEYTCSLCGATFKRLYKAKFCPNCWAEMEESDAEIH